MTFDEWMKKQNPEYEIDDDTVALRLLRKCWNEAISKREDISLTEQLVERLREHADRVAGERSRGSSYDPETFVLERVAADRLEALWREYKYLKETRG